METLRGVMVEWVAGGRAGGGRGGRQDLLPSCCAVQTHSSTCQPACLLAVAGDTNATKAVPLFSKHAHYSSLGLDPNKRSHRPLLTTATEVIDNII
jgi:hypothetical protein